MSTITDMDTGPLTWVKGEIDLALGRATEAIEAARAGEDRSNKLQFAQTHLHQVRGALSIVGLDGLTSFADSLDRLLAELARGERTYRPDLADLSRRALAAIGNYLDELNHGVPDQALRLLPLLTELAAARGQPAPSPADLFFPDLGQRLPRRAKPPPSNAAAILSQRIRQFRSRFQAGLLTWLRQPGSDAGPRAMAAVCDEIEALQTAPTTRSLWWAARACFDTLAAGGLGRGPLLQGVCSRLDNQLKRIASGQNTAPERLQREILYLIASASSVGPAGQEVRDTFSLGTLIPPVGSALCDQPLAPLLTRLRTLFAAARDTWDHFAGGAAAALPQFEQDLHAAIEASAPLGRPAFRHLLDTLGEVVAWLRKDPLRFNDPLALEVATAVMLAETALETGRVPDASFTAQVTRSSERLRALMAGDDLAAREAESAGLPDAAREAQERMALGQLAREMQVNLAHVEQTLDDYFRHPERKSGLPGLNAPLRQIAGVLSVLGEDRALELLRDCEGRIQALAASENPPPAGEFEYLAHHLSAFGFYLQDLPGGEANLDRLLRGESAPELPADEEPLGAPEEIAVEPPPAPAGQTKAPAERAAAAAPERPEPVAEPDEVPEEAVVPPTAAPVPPPPAAELLESSDAEIDSELLEIFLEEGREVVATIGETLAHSRLNPRDVELVTTIRRGFHTLKGSGRMVGLTELGEVAWGMEQTMNRWLQLEWMPTPALFDLIGAAHALFRGWIEQLASGGGVHRDATELLAEARRLRECEQPLEESQLGMPAEESGGETAARIEKQPSAPAAPLELDLDAVEPGAESPAQPVAAYTAPETDGSEAEPLESELDLEATAPFEEPYERRPGSSDDAEPGDALRETSLEFGDLMREPADDGVLPIGAIKPSSAEETSLEAFELSEDGGEIAEESDDIGEQVEEIDFGDLEDQQITLGELSLDDEPEGLGGDGEAFSESPSQESIEAAEPAEDLGGGDVEGLDRADALQAPLAESRAPDESDQFALIDEQSDAPAYSVSVLAADGEGQELDLDLPDEIEALPLDSLELGQDEIAAVDEQSPVPELAEATPAVDDTGLDLPGELEAPTYESLESDFDDDAPVEGQAAVPLAERNLDLDFDLDLPDQIEATPRESLAPEQNEVAASDEHPEVPAFSEAPLAADDDGLGLDLDLPGEFEAESLESPEPELDEVAAGDGQPAAPAFSETSLGADDEGLDLDLDLPGEFDAEPLESLDAELEEVAAGDGQAAAPEFSETCLAADDEGLDLDLDLPGDFEAEELEALEPDQDAIVPDAEPAEPRAFGEVSLATEDDGLDLDLDFQDGIETASLESLETDLGNLEPGTDFAAETAAAVAFVPPENEAVGSDDESDGGQVTFGEHSISRPLFDLYLSEARQHLTTLKREVVHLHSNPTLLPAEPAVRAAHTLAGISGTAHVPAVQLLSKSLEHAQARFRDSGRPPADEQTELLSRSVDTLEAMLAEVGHQILPLPVPELVEQLDSILRIDADSAPQTAVPASTTEEATEAEAPPAPVLRDEFDEQLLPIFLEEAGELLGQLQAGLSEWRNDPASSTPVALLARLLHTLKGSARMAGAMSLGERVHGLETRLSDRGAEPQALIDELEAGLDSVSLTLDEIAGAPVSTTAEPAAPALAAAPQPAPGLVPTVAEPEPAAASGSLRVRADLVDKFVNEAGEIGIARTRIEGELRTLRRSLLDLTENVIRLRNQLREIEIQAETQLQSRIALSAGADGEFDPLELDRFTRLQELTRMMAESVNDVTTVQHNLLKNLDGAESAMSSQARLNRDLQQALMRVRMVPFDSIADRLHRVVRQSAKDLGRRVTLDIQAGSTEIDRGVLERMTAPLEHLLRNSIAHGIEEPAARQRAGKAEIGQITIRLAQEGNEIAIALADDGAGLNFERIRARALENGLIDASSAQDEKQLTNLIFMPGFSTATSLSAVSGRGVGMDVVKSETAACGGRIEIASSAGQGTTFRIYLPVNLAVTQALLVRAGPRTYAIPSTMVAQVRELKADAIEQLRREREIVWQDESYSYRYLPRLVGDAETQPEIQRFNWILLLRAGAQTLALHVDSLRGNQEIVVKNAGPHLARIVGISGATVMGDGEIVLILNPVALAARPDVIPDEVHGIRTAQVVAHVPTVMVVDDSLTVRKITGRVLEREGYRVVTAKDGVDALERMIETIPDVILSDIEMPRMDGFDLARNIRADQRLKSLPIIMITSRLADKHKEYAREIGVNHYLGKPYQEAELLEHIRRYAPLEAAVA